MEFERNRSGHSFVEEKTAPTQIIAHDIPPSRHVTERSDFTLGANSTIERDEAVHDLAYIVDCTTFVKGMFYYKVPRTIVYRLRV